MKGYSNSGADVFMSLSHCFKGKLKSTYTNTQQPTAQDIADI